jgi:MFS family permease
LNAHPTLQVLASPDLRAFLAARFFGAMARALLHAALVWHVFAVTREELWLGALGLVEFLPVVPVALVGGSVADAHDRRSVVAASQAAALALAAALFAASSGGGAGLPLLLGVAFLLRVTWGFEFPAAQALLPALVPREIFQNAVVTSATVRNLAVVSGPVAAGFAIDAAGVGSAYGIASGLYLLSALALLRVRRRAALPSGTARGLAAVGEGVRFVRRSPVLLAAMTLDMVAVILADPTVLLAVYSEEILAVGPRGYGVLSASMAMGTLGTTLLLLFRPPFALPGRWLVGSVALFGAAAAAFGASGAFALSVAALVAAGAADQVSQVARSTIIQLSTPDELRGRVSAVNMVFVSASNELGAAFSGFLAAATSAVFAVVGGGVVCLAAAGVVAARVPALSRWQAAVAVASAAPAAGGSPQSEGRQKRSM